MIPWIASSKSSDQKPFWFWFCNLYPFIENSTTGIAIITGGTDADRKAISRAEIKSRAEKERDDATPSTSKAALKELEAEKGAKPATQSDLSAAKSSHGTSKLSLSTVKDQLAKEKATSEARLKELEAEKSSHDTTKLKLEAVQAELNQLQLKKAKKSGKWVDVDYGWSLTSHFKKKFGTKYVKPTN